MSEINTFGLSVERAEELLAAEALRVQLVQEEIQRRIYCGELEATDGDSVVTMRDLQ